MKRFLSKLVPLALLLPVLGCAGGWRNGAPPEAAPAPAAAVTGSRSIPADAAPASGTQPTPDGALFVFTGAATSVHVAGEFNGWSTSTDALVKQADGKWTLKKKLSPGRYLYKFVLDGGTWKEDPGAKETADDGFGGKNSVLVVGGAAAPAAVAAAAAASAAAVPSAAAPAVTGDGVVFRFSGPASSVNLAGEFNSWSTSADPLVKQADGTWAITKKLPAGRHPYKFVLDGGTWKEDPSAKESVDDSFGGKNSVVVVGAGGAAPAATSSAPAAPATAKPVTGKPRAPQVTAAGVVFTYAGSARSVALCGAFNQWAPNTDPMQQQADGTWTLTKKLPAGAHAYKFLVDGAQWKTDDANTASEDDGFGGKNSLVTVK